MSFSTPRFRRPMIGLMGLAFALAGCGTSTEVKLVDVPQRAILPSHKVAELPKNLRPRPGSSAALGRDPSGIQH
jgi:hypothetical protein